MLTQTRLKELLYYDEFTGIFTWIKSRRCLQAGDRAGYIFNKNRGKEYMALCVDGKRYLMHRLVWMYVYGSFPSNDIDHINGSGMDNRLCNLREVDRIGNMRNSRLYSNNSSGCFGVCYSNSRRKWEASITINYKTVHLGRHLSLFDAVCARKSAEIKYGFHVNHGNKQIVAN